MCVRRRSSQGERGDGRACRGLWHARKLPAGTLVFERGQRSVSFFLVLEGAIEIFELDEHGAPHVFTTHAVRQFTGEVDLFNYREILVSGRAAVDSQVVRLPRAEFQHMVSAEPNTNNRDT